MAYNIKLDTQQNQIRLLHLSPPSQGSNEIRCSFSLATIDEEVPYEALSYAWGSTDDRISITVEGNPFLVTPNLHTALLHLRLPDRERVLWVDALCINQTDLHERTHQVSHIKSIYERATRVVVWLGAPWNGYELALDLLEILGNNRDIHLSPSLDPCITVRNLTLESEELSGHVIRLISVPWWTRTWTVQEFILAKELMFQCGNRTLDRELVFRANGNFAHHYNRCCRTKALKSTHSLLGFTLVHSFIAVERLGYTKRAIDQASLLYTVSRYSGQQATDPRDRIYGMLGLGFGPYSNIIEPDYTISPEQVCQNFAFESVERTGKLEFLIYVNPEAYLKLPSFVPRWTGTFDWSENYANQLGFLSSYRASCNTRAHLRLVSPGRIVTRGKIIDIIDSKMHHQLSDKKHFQELRRLSKLPKSRNLEEWSSLKPSEQSEELAFMRSMCGDMERFYEDSIPMQSRFKNSIQLRESFQKWTAWIAASPESKEKFFNLDVANFDLNFGAVEEGRLFIVTKKGYLGFAPERCKTGDLVVVLAGGDVPYILRPAPKQNLGSLDGMRPKKEWIGRRRRLSQFVSDVIHTKRPSSSNISESANVARSDSDTALPLRTSAFKFGPKATPGEGVAEGQSQSYIILGDCYIYKVLWMERHLRVLMRLRKSCRI